LDADFVAVFVFTIDNVCMGVYVPVLVVIPVFEKEGLLEDVFDVTDVRVCDPEPVLVLDEVIDDVIVGVFFIVFV
jgi:hypothetical protein